MGYTPKAQDGSLKLETKLERLAILLSTHKTRWTVKRVAEEFGWTEVNARRNMARSDVQARSAFLGRQEIKRLGLMAMNEMAALLKTTDNDRLRYDICRDLMDRAGFGTAPAPEAPPAFSFNFMIGQPQKVIDGNREVESVHPVQPARLEAAEERSQGADAPGRKARELDD